jgi:hypothetical protein
MPFSWGYPGATGGRKIRDISAGATISHGRGYRAVVLGMEISLPWAQRPFPPSAVSWPIWVTRKEDSRGRHRVRVRRRCRSPGAGHHLDVAGLDRASVAIWATRPAWAMLRRVRSSGGPCGDWSGFGNESCFVTKRRQSRCRDRQAVAH